MMGKARTNVQSAGRCHSSLATSTGRIGVDCCRTPSALGAPALFVQHRTGFVGHLRTIQLVAAIPGSLIVQIPASHFRIPSVAASGRTWIRWSCSIATAVASVTAQRMLEVGINERNQTCIWWVITSSSASRTIYPVMAGPHRPAFPERKTGESRPRYRKRSLRY